MKKLDNMVQSNISSKNFDLLTQENKRSLKKSILLMMLALTALAVGLLVMAINPEQVAVGNLIYLVGILIIGFPIFYNAVKGIIKSDISASTEILVSLAMLAAMMDEQFMLALSIPIILTLVHFLEEKSILGGKDAISQLKLIQSDTAIIVENGIEREVKAKSLKVGDIIIVKAGMSFAIDGEIIEGESNVDLKSLTGESKSIFVQKQNKVFAGTINLDGVLKVRVEKEFHNTSFQQIISLMNENQKIVLPETRIVDKFMLYYLPFSILLAVVVFMFTQDLSRAISVLVVSCPCGYVLVNSTPMLSAFSAAAKRGIIIKNSSFIEKLADVNKVIFDKTGTLTTGELEITNYKLVQAENYEELVNVACIIASKSTHPVSKTIMQLAESDIEESEYLIKEEAGKGISGKYDNDEIVLCNTRWFLELGYTNTDLHEEEGAVTWVVRNNTVLGCFILRDIARDNAKQVLKTLKQSGVDETIMLTGDNEYSAKKIKRAVLVDTCFDSLLPQDKLTKVEEYMQSNTVAVVGDGINDVLALSRSDVGIAMGAMGADSAIQSADIALMNNDLSNIPFAIELSKRTRVIIRQNLGIAFTTSIIMIFLASFGIISAFMGAFLHNIGAFFVLLNSGRLLRSSK